MRQTLRAYLELTKPRILELLLVTTIPVMVFAADGRPDLGLMAAVLVGGALSAGSAGAFNMYIERESDALMERTAQRPLVTGAVSPRAKYGDHKAFQTMLATRYPLLLTFYRSASILL